MAPRCSEIGNVRQMISFTVGGVPEVEGELLGERFIKPVERL
jgi:hypothetical protein